MDTKEQERIAKTILEMSGVIAELTQEATELAVRLEAEKRRLIKTVNLPFNLRIDIRRRQITFD